MSRWLFVMLCFGILFISGCSREVRASDVAGSYTANHGKGIDTLEINADGTYSHSYKSTLEGDDTAFSQDGKWELEQGGGRIVFERYIKGWSWRPGAEVDLTPRSKNTVVKKSIIAGKVKILIDVDSNYWYEKQES